MKQRLHPLCVALLALVLCNTPLFAEDFTVDGIYYNITSETDKTVEVTYQGTSHTQYENEYSGSVTIPESVNYNGTTYSVTTIENNAFNMCQSLTHVTIPNSITCIGWGCFTSCSSLTEITIPNSVISIGPRAFANCPSLTHITVSKDNPIYDSRDNCNAIVETQTNTLIVGCCKTTIPNTVTAIGDWGFYDCTSLTEIIIPNSVTTIGRSAFQGCYSLIHITIPNSVSIIEESVFSGCFGMTGITIPNSVTTIGNFAFEYCSSLMEITIPNSVTTIGYYAFSGCKSLMEIAIPNSVTSIGVWAFANCSGLSHVTIPNSVTTIEGALFYGCTSLTDVNLSNSITTIGNHAFYGCSKLTGIIIPNSVTSIGEWAFRECSSLTSVVIPNSVTSIGESAFEDCSCLTSVVIGNRVTSIDSAVFSNCTDLLSVEIPNSVTSIGIYAFRECSSLTSVEIPNSVTSIGDNAFWLCFNMTSVEIPNSVTSIGIDAFADCSALTTATVGCSWKKNPLYDFGANVTVNVTLHSYENGICTVCGDKGNIELVEGTNFANELQQEVAQVTYNRTLPNLEWNALYLPVEIPVAALSENYDLAYFNNMHAYDRNNDGTVDEMDMEVFLINEGTLHANYPYFIRAKSEDAKQLQLVLEDVVLHAAEETSLTCSSVFIDFALTGVYARNDAETLSGCYAINTSGAWSPIAAGSYLNPFRCYLKMTARNGTPVKVDEALQTIRIRVKGEGETTGIADAFVNGQQPAAIYDLQGRRVMVPQKGKIYIVGGKKMVF